MSTLSRWNIFFKERFPIVPNIIITAGLVATSYGVYRTPFQWGVYSFTFLVFFLFLGQLRFMDELKDVEKDKVAHPERPLPRGLISTAEMNVLINIVQAILFLLAFSAFYFFNTYPATSLVLGISWLYLMYKEFYIGSRVSKYPFLYAVTHQIIIIPMGVFAMSAIADINYFDMKIMCMSGLLLSTFFIYEISRKLDPQAIPLLNTYLIISGRTNTMIAITALSLMALFTSVYLELGGWVSIPLFIMYFSHIIIYIKPDKFKITEGIVTLYLLYMIWILPIRNLF